MRLTILLTILFIVTVIFIIDRLRRRQGQSGVVEHFFTDVVPIIHRETPHCYNPKLMALMSAFKSQHFEVVEKLLLNFSEDYRSYGFEMLAEMGDKDIIQTWLEQSNHEIPRILMGMRIIDEAWEIRGGGFADTVSATRGMNFHELLEKAEGILTHATNKNSSFEINRLVALLTVYKGLAFDRTAIQETFAQAVAIAPQHIGLHVQYFDAISSKWGGTEEEVTVYLNEIMPSEPQLLSNCILALYYRDLLHVSSVDDPMMLQEIRGFVTRISILDEPIENLHRATLYEYMAQIAHIKSPTLVTKYEDLLLETYQRPF